jgi:hypothetical protein
MNVRIAERRYNSFCHVNAGQKPEDGGDFNPLAFRV